jgi:hypothetical protein
MAAAIYSRRRYIVAARGDIRTAADIAAWLDVHG